MKKVLKTTYRSRRVWAPLEHFAFLSLLGSQNDWISEINFSIPPKSQIRWHQNWYISEKVSGFTVSNLSQRSKELSVGEDESPEW